MNLKEIVAAIQDFIKQVGFPVGVAIWLLWESHTTINELKNAINALEHTMGLIRTTIVRNP